MIDSASRRHFHEWILDIHSRLHTLKKAEISDDPIEYLTEQMIQQSWLICFDEFQVTDVADALLVRRLFTSMFEKGAVMVATSNRHPRDLYKGGLQRDLFLPFIDLLQDKCEVHSLSESAKDYRVIKAQQSLDDAYLSPLIKEKRRIFEETFESYVEGADLVSMHLETQGREVRIPTMASSPRVAKFKFSDLCEQPLGAADYLCIAQAFPTIFISDIPRMGMNDLNTVRRFITMVDCFYDQKVQLYVLAEALPHELFTKGDGVKSGSQSVHDEVFAFDRTVSRLNEVRACTFCHSIL